MTSLFMWRQSTGRAVKVEKVKGEEAGVLRKHTHTSAIHANSSAHGCHAGGGTYAATNTPGHKLQSEFLPPDITLLPVWLRGRGARIKRRAESRRREQLYILWTVRLYRSQRTVHKVDTKSVTTWAGRQCLAPVQQILQHFESFSKSLLDERK